MGNTRHTIADEHFLEFASLTDGYPLSAVFLLLPVLYLVLQSPLFVLISFLTLFGLISQTVLTFSIVFPGYMIVLLNSRKFIPLGIFPEILPGMFQGIFPTLEFCE